MGRGLPARALLRCLIAAGLLPAWTGCARYVPAPIHPEAHAAAFRARRLDDPALVAFVTRHAGAPADGRWSDVQLAVAALAQRADLERARREWLAASAGIAAAGLRPPPGVQGDVERAVGGRDEGNPWVVSVAGLFPVELGGKRAARVQAARARAAVAEADLALEVRETLGRVRSAALAVRHLEEERDALAAAATALREVEGLERARFAEAALASSEVARTAADAAAARVATATAARQASLARADLAGALAMPAGALRALRLEPDGRPACGWADSLSFDTLAALALPRRPEVARALAGYALAEAEVRAQVAERWPDLELGPGFIWDQGIHRWTVAFALPTLLRLRSHEPIRAAEARRLAVAARVAEVQDLVLGEVARAREDCRGARIEQAVADSQSLAAERVAALARAAYQRGETGRLEAAQADLLLLRARAVARASSRALERAGLALEVALGEWRAADAVRWPDPRTGGLLVPEETQ